MKSIIYSILVIFTLIPCSVISVKCYICEFNAAFCKGIDCYNNPDICSSNQFSTALVPVAECPQNCQLKAISNPSGMVIKWSRFCAPASDLTKGFKCRTDFRIGARIDQCTCDRDYCNDSISLQIKLSIVIFCLSSSFALYKLMII